MESIISNLITTLGAFVLVYLSVIKDNYSSKYKIRREQLDKFYIPFYKLYCRGFLSENPLSLMTPEVRGSILELLSDCIHDIINPILTFSKLRMVVHISRFQKPVLKWTLRLRF